jgi:hypothetical protein
MLHDWRAVKGVVFCFGSLGRDGHRADSGERIPLDEMKGQELG